MPISGKVRAPRAWLSVGGNNIHILECAVYLTNYQSASEFTADMALDDPTNPGAAFWAGQSGPIPASITGDNGDGSGQNVLITGTIEKASVDFRQRKVSVHGVDLTKDALNTRSDESFQNQSVSDIVGTIASRHGWTPHIDTTSDKAGKTFDFQNYAFNSDIQNDWDTLTQLAEREGKIVYLIGKDLHFTTAGNTTGQNFNVEYTPPGPDSVEAANVVELKCLIDYGATGQVTVASWQTNKKAPVVGEQNMFSGISGGGILQYYDRKAGLTSDQAIAQANATAKMAGAFQMQVEVDCPGDVNVTQSMMLVLSGTGTNWDTEYFIETVTHRFSTHSGYRMQIEAKNIQGSGSLSAPGTGDL